MANQNGREQPYYFQISLKIFVLAFQCFRSSIVWLHACQRSAKLCCANVCVMCVCSSFTWFVECLFFFVFFFGSRLHAACLSARFPSLVLLFWLIACFARFTITVICYGCWCVWLKRLLCILCFVVALLRRSFSLLSGQITRECQSRIAVTLCIEQIFSLCFRNC